jgi:hypothetical protein
MGEGIGSGRLKTPGYTDYDEKHKNDTSSSKYDRYDKDVDKYLRDELKCMNGRDTAKTRAETKEVVDLISAGLGTTLNTNLGGSVRKNTYVEGISDVDQLLYVDNTKLAAMTPKDVLKYMHAKCIGKIDALDIRQGKLALTITKYDGQELQFLPAIDAGNGKYRIPSGKDNKWSNPIDPKKFTDELTAANRACGGNAIPAVKVIKKMIHNAGLDDKIGGYSIENYMIDAVKNSKFNSDTSIRVIVRETLSTAARSVKHPTLDVTRQSRYIDERLGPANSVNRNYVSSELKNLRNKVNLADNEQNVSVWKDLIGDN